MAASLVLFCNIFLKGHVNKADFLGVSHKSVLLSPLHLPFERSDFGLVFSEIFVIDKRVPDLASRGVDKIF